MGGSNRQCPICRKKLISKRDLRPDENFDNLIATIVPDRSILERHHQQVNKIPCRLLRRYRDHMLTNTGGGNPVTAAERLLIVARPLLLLIAPTYLANGKDSPIQQPRSKHGDLQHRHQGMLAGLLLCEGKVRKRSIYVRPEQLTQEYLEQDTCWHVL